MGPESGIQQETDGRIVLSEKLLIVHIFFRNVHGDVVLRKHWNCHKLIASCL